MSVGSPTEDGPLNGSPSVAEDALFSKFKKVLSTQSRRIRFVLMFGYGIRPVGAEIGTKK